MAFGRVGNGVILSAARGLGGNPSPPNDFLSGILEPLGVRACSENDRVVGRGEWRGEYFGGRGMYFTSRVPSLILTEVFHLGLDIRLEDEAERFGRGREVMRFPVGVVLVFLAAIDG